MRAAAPERARRPQPSREPRGVRPARGAPHRARPPSKKEAAAAYRGRLRAGRLIMFVALGIAALQLVWIQTVAAPKLAAEAAKQSKRQDVPDPATRGAITDRNGKPLAFTVAAKALTFQPQRVRKELAEQRAKNPKAPEPDNRLQAIARELHTQLGSAAPEQDMLKLLRSDNEFVYLVRSVDSPIATRIGEKFPEVGLERKPLREYPGGSLAANVIGSTGADGHGQIGLETVLDAQLAGTDGSYTYDQSSDGVEIPGSRRDQQPAVHGASVELTLDSDLQYYVQQQVQQAKQISQARNASAVVLDAKTGEILAMSNDNTFDPSLGLGRADPNSVGNRSVSSPFEPGSVNKIVTAAAAIEYGLTNPHEVLQVPGRIRMAGVTVKDAWDHGTAPYTTTGIFGKSSNVGTLMLAQRVGEDRFADMLKRFGLGKRTESGLQGESAGQVPARAQWSGGTFANLPIGQGLSMTLLQMTGMYQAVANDGVRVPPRIVRAKTDPGGQRTPAPRPDGVRVVSGQTAATLRTIFQSVTQKDPTGVQQGTGVPAAIEGYQIAGKTGTAQKTDEACKCYSGDKFWITFAGIAPADNPRYVVGIMLDQPTRGPDGSGYASAAPLFHNIASWALQRDGVPLSREPSKKVVLQAT